jgi:hypothetical protein
MRKFLLRIPLFFGCCILVVLPLAAQDNHEKHKSLVWAPPNVSAAVPHLESIPPCDLSKVLEGVGAHAVELTTNLQNFAAEEYIQFEMMDQYGMAEQNDAGAFDYTLSFEQQNTGVSTREYRTPAKGGHNFEASRQDMGQVALALIFLPTRQSDYDMTCEGVDKRDGASAWLVRFQQRKDQPRRTLVFSVKGELHPAMLKGRAWISIEHLQVMRLEAALMQDIPSMGIQSGIISVDYAPVQIESKKLELWLPQRIEAYWQILSHRVMLYHTFSDFKLFSVDTQQNIEKPKQ